MKDLTTLRDRASVGLWLNDAGLTGEGAEIGVQEGRNAEAILTHWKGTLHLVDPWMRQMPSAYHDGTNDIDFEAAYVEACRRMKPFAGRYVFHRDFSDHAFEYYKGQGDTFQFVYLDGNHSMPQVGRDLEQWWTLLEPGGLFGGHDYLTSTSDDWTCDVEEAVNAFAAKHHLPLHITYDIPTAEIGGWPSWWIVKPEA